MTNTLKSSDASILRMKLDYFLPITLLVAEFAMKTTLSSTKVYENLFLLELIYCEY